MSAVGSRWVIKGVGRHRFACEAVHPATSSVGISVAREVSEEMKNQHLPDPHAQLAAEGGLDAQLTGGAPHFHGPEIEGERSP